MSANFSAGDLGMFGSEELTLAAQELESFIHTLDIAELAQLTSEQKIIKISGLLRQQNQVRLGFHFQMRPDFWRAFCNRLDALISAYLQEAQ